MDYNCVVVSLQAYAIIHQKNYQNHIHNLADFLSCSKRVKKEDLTLKNSKEIHAPNNWNFEAKNYKSKLQNKVLS